MNIKKLFGLLIKENSDLNRVIKNFFSLSILQVLNMIFPLLLIPYFVRILGVNQFGLLVFSQTFVMYFSLFVDYGFNITATRLISLNRNDKIKISKIFYSVMFIKILLFIISTIVFYIIVNYVPKFKIDKSIYEMAYLVIIGQILFPVWFFQGIEDMKMITILNLLIKVLYFIGTIFFVKESHDLIIALAINSLSFILIGVFSLYFVFKYINIKKIIFDYKFIIKLFKDSTYVFISNLFSSLYGISNNFLLGIFGNNDLLGIYASFEKIITAIKSLYIPLYQALFPFFSRKKHKKDLIKKMIFPIGFISFIFVVLLYFYSDKIILLLYKSKILMESIFYFKVMTIIPVLSGLNMLFNFLYLNSVKMYKERMVIMMYAGIFSFTLTLILLNIKFGILSVVISFILTETLLLILGWKVFIRGIE